MQIIIKSKRIYLKKFKSSDVTRQYKKWMEDPAISQFLIYKKSANISDLKKYVENLDNINYFFFKIVDIKSNKHIGNVKLGPLNYKTKSANFGILIGDKNFHNMGIGSETTQLVTDFLFNFLNFKKIEFVCFSKNIQAIKMYEKLKFMKKKTTLKVKFKNETHNQIVFYKYNNVKKTN